MLKMNEDRYEYVGYLNYTLNNDVYLECFYPIYGA